MAETNETIDAAGEAPAKSHLGRATAALFGGTGAISFAPIFAKFGEGYLGIVALAFWRVAIALPALATYAFFKTGRHPFADAAGHVDRRAVWMALVAGVFFGIDLSLYHMAMGETTAGNATLLSNCAPIFVALAAWMIFKERFGRVFVVGLVFAIAGAIVLSWAQTRMDAGNVYDPTGADHAADATDASSTLRGDLLAFGSAIFYAGYQLCIKRARQTLNTQTGMTLSMTASTVVITIIAIARGDAFLPSAWQGWMAVLGLALLVQLGGQVVIVYAIGHLPVSFATVGLLAQPILVMVLGWVLLGESLSAWHVVGAAAVLVGIYLARRGSDLRKTNSKPETCA
jgi:drug/metabolite transporter (DMT)-like permease